MEREEKKWNRRLNTILETKKFMSAKWKAAASSQQPSETHQSIAIIHIFVSNYRLEMVFSLGFRGAQKGENAA